MLVDDASVMLIGAAFILLLVGIGLFVAVILSGREKSDKKRAPRAYD
jgi:hypothetical protein